MLSCYVCVPDQPTGALHVSTNLKQREEVLSKTAENI